MTATEQPTARRLYFCRCGRPIFFRNSYCIACQTPLGYEPELGELFPLAENEDGTWRIENGGHFAPQHRENRYVRCANLTTAAGCNWLIPADSGGPALCVACGLNRTIPDLSVPGNEEKWRRIELAKRRLISSLVRLGLPVRSQLGDAPVTGLVFDFLNPDAHGQVVTGHADGVITLNVQEADHPTREKMREKMDEPYRTVLGHLRHEIGHYYWTLLINGTAWGQPFSGLFGDPGADYEQALQRHYNQGPPPGWQENYISAYATAHPWEDWAETWAHYLHMTDTLDTADSFHLKVDEQQLPMEGFTEEALYRTDDAEAQTFLDMVNRWIQISAALNELSLSMGFSDFYPFVLSSKVVQKLHFVHLAVRDGAARGDGTGS